MTDKQRVIVNASVKIRNCQRCNKNVACHWIEGEPRNNYAQPYRVEPSPWRIAYVCQACADDYGFDLWTDQSEWESLDPVIAWKDLDFLPENEGRP